MSDIALCRRLGDKHVLFVSVALVLRRLVVVYILKFYHLLF